MMLRSFAGSSPYIQDACEMIPGVDIVSVKRIKKVFGDPSRLKRIFTPSEIEYIRSHKETATVTAWRFAAKEAIYKCLSPLGIKFEYDQISIITDRDKGPEVIAETPELKEKLSGKTLNISISPEDDFAVAFCILYEE